MTSNTQLAEYQKLYLRKEELYATYRTGKIDLDTVAREITKIDRRRPRLARIARVLVGAFLPLLFVRSR